MDRKEMARRYKETPRPAGVFRVTHTPSGRTLLGSSKDAPAMLNRIQAELRTRGHRNKKLQADWDAGGPDAFEFEILDLLSPKETAGYDPSEDLVALEELWRDKLHLDPEDRY
jgi:hypothetical protein